jgi:ubiquitin-conjugating enzyme E2 J2
VYHGKVKFPEEYPFKPPGISMITPNGRFATNKRICMSMSDCMYLTFMYRLYVSSILLLFYIHCYQILDNLSGCTLCI